MPRPPRDARAFFRYWIDAAGAYTAGGFLTLEETCWKDQRRAENVLLAHYNDLKADLDGEMRRISAFLDNPVDEAIWPSLVEAASFEAMKRDGDALLGNLERRFEGGHHSFLNKAVNGRWQGEVDPEDPGPLAAEKIEAALSPDLIAWLEGGRAATGDPREIRG